MRKSYLFALAGLVLGSSAPLGALLWLWFLPHPALPFSYFIEGEWQDHLFFFTYMLVGTSLAFSLFGFILGRNADRLLTENRDLSSKVLTDPLTGLGNHRFLHETFRIEFNRHLRSRQPISCLMMDLDFFKRVNDNYGHPFGDQVLRQFALLLRKCVRSGDVASRYGGEEFLCVLPNCGRDSAREVAERIRREMAGHIFLSGRRRVRVTVSLGLVTCYKSASLDYRQMIQLSDQALYEAKRKGRNRVIQTILDSDQKFPQAEQSKTPAKKIRQNNRLSPRMPRSLLN